MIEGSFQLKLLATNKTSAVSVAAGRFLKALVAALPIAWLGNGIRRARGVRFTPFVAGANDTTATGTLAIVRQGGTNNNDGGGVDDFEVIVLGTVTMTAGNFTGVSGGGLLGTSDRGVDTIVLTKSVACTKLESEFGRTVVVHSPGDNTQGWITLPDAFNAVGVVLDLAPGTATSVNALFEVGT